MSSSVRYRTCRCRACRSIACETIVWVWCCGRKNRKITKGKTMWSLQNQGNLGFTFFVKLVLTSCRGAGGLSCGGRARGALFYKVSAGSDFLSGGVKWCVFCENGVVNGVVEAGFLLPIITLFVAELLC